MISLMNLEIHWLWIIAGLLLVAVETLAPGIFLVWVGLAALATGLLAWLIPLSLTAQFLLFALLGLVSILVGRSIQSHQQNEATDSPFLNERGKALLGTTFILETAIANGAGTVRHGDSIWRVTGVDLPAGSSVIVRAIDGSTLKVEAALTQ
jgi:inner membrane protein